MPRCTLSAVSGWLLYLDRRRTRKSNPWHPAVRMETFDMANERRASFHIKPSCPGSEPEGGFMLEKLLQMILPLALAIGVWAAIVLPWDGAG